MKYIFVLGNDAPGGGDVAADTSSSGVPIAETVKGFQNGRYKTTEKTPVYGINNISIGSQSKCILPKHTIVSVVLTQQKRSKQVNGKILEVPGQVATRIGENWIMLKDAIGEKFAYKIL